MPLLERSKVTVWERHLFKERFAMEVLSLGLPFVKWYFEEHHLCAFLFMAEITEILLFSGMPLLERSKRPQFENDTFSKKKKYYGRFVFVSTLRKNVFWGAAVKCVFLYGSNNSDFFIFGNAAFGKIKDHSWSRISQISLFKNNLTINFFFGDVSSVKRCFVE